MKEVATIGSRRSSIRSVLLVLSAAMAGVGFASMGTGVAAATTPPPATLTYSTIAWVDSQFNVGSQTYTSVSQAHNSTMVDFTMGSGFTVYLADSNPYSLGEHSNGTVTAGNSPGGQACSSTVSDFIVDEASYDSTTGQLSSYAARYVVQCNSATVAPGEFTEIFGTIAYNMPNNTAGQGYYIYGASGEVSGFGNNNYLAYLGSPDLIANLNQPIVGMAPTADKAGAWYVAADGGIFAYGDATFYGSMGGRSLNEPIVGIAPTPDGKGYLEVAADGGIFSFGDANFYGSMGGHPLNEPIVGIAPTPDGRGYLEVASDGGIFAFGDANFYGSMGGHPLKEPIVGIALSADGQGYWEVAADGGIFSFGDANFHGSMGGHPLNEPIVSMTSTSDGQGYWEVAADGGIFSFGDATFYGSLGNTGIVDTVGITR